MIKPALRRGWRDRRTVQFGVAPAHAVVLGPVDTATGSFLTLLDGTRGLPLLRSEAASLGLTGGRVDELLERLAAAGLLDDPTADGAPDPADREPDGARERLRPDLASLSVVHPEPGGGDRRMAARRAAEVRVRGSGRVGTVIAAVLSAAGVGRVEVMDGGCVEPWEVAPGGFPAEAVGRRREAAARQVVRAAAPGPRGPRRRASRPERSAGPGGTAGPGLSLVVLAPRDGLDAYAPDPVAAEPLLAAGTPHLYAGVIEATGVVGPLVLPGGSACAGCLEEEWADREPGRPLMLAQWRSGRRPAGLACDTALTTVVAGLAASQALSFLDGELPVSVGGRLEFALPGPGWLPRRIMAHPACGCGAAGAPAGSYSSDGGERRGQCPGDRGLPGGPEGSPPGECSGVGGANV